MGATASYALSNRNVGLPGPDYPTYYAVSAWYGYRLVGPLHLGLIGDANTLAGSVAILLEVYGSLVPYIDIGVGIASGPTWYWERQFRTLETRGGHFDAHAEVLGRITPSVSVGARIGFTMNSFDEKPGVEPSDEPAHYFWAWPAGVLVNIRL